MQLSASSTFLDLLAAPTGQPAVPAAGLPTDATAVAGNFGALLSAQTQPAAAAAVPTTENLLASTTPAGPGSITTATSAPAEGSPASFDAGLVPAAGTVLTGLGASLSAELGAETEVAAESTVAKELSALARTAGNAFTTTATTLPAVKQAPPVRAGAGQPLAGRGAIAADPTQTPTPPATSGARTATAATPVRSGTKADTVAREAGKTNSVSNEPEEAGTPITAEITAAWLAANGSTVVVAHPAGELITVDISLSVPQASASSLCDLVDGTPATDALTAPVTTDTGKVVAVLTASNSFPAPDQTLKTGPRALPDSAQPGPRSAALAASTTELPPPSPRDERGDELPATASVSPQHPAYPTPRAGTPDQVPAANAAPSAHAVSAVNVPALRVSVAISSTPVVTQAQGDPASPVSGAAPDDAPAAGRAVDFLLSGTSAGRMPGGAGTEGVSVGPNRPVSPPAISGAGSSGSHPYRAAEKFAGAAEGGVGASSPVGVAKLKNILAATGESLTNHSASLGINVAKPQARMPALAHPTPSPFAENDPLSFRAVPLTFDTLVQDTTETTANPFTSSARRAVDSAMAVVDHFAKGAQRGVNLQFSVSGLDLAVRVEMRPDGVHTIFRTDSPELRNALAQEWQSVVSTQPTDRPQRLADPVFTSTSAGGPASGDHGASQQRESGTPQSQWEKATAFAPPAVARAATEIPLTAVSTGPRLAPHGTARHLSALA